MPDLKVINVETVNLVAIIIVFLSIYLAIIVYFTHCAWWQVICHFDGLNMNAIHDCIVWLLNAASASSDVLYKITNLNNSRKSTQGILCTLVQFCLTVPMTHTAFLHPQSIRMSVNLWPVTTFHYIVDWQFNISINSWVKRIQQIYSFIFYLLHLVLQDWAMCSISIPFPSQTCNLLWKIIHQPLPYEGYFCTLESIISLSFYHLQQSEQCIIHIFVRGWDEIGVNFLGIKQQRVTQSTKSLSILNRLLLGSQNILHLCAWFLTLDQQFCTISISIKVIHLFKCVMKMSWFCLPQA